jgi:hypothetical protein
LESSFNHTNPAFSIAIVNYKTPDLTKICLDLLKKHIDAGLNAQVWVVDNNSQDESTTYLRSLDWIHLIVRDADYAEKGFVAHGQGLDSILEKIETDYVFLMHTDTFVYDASIFNQTIQLLHQHQHIAALGCLEQLDRGLVRTVWRVVSRFFKRHSRRFKLWLGLNAKPPKSYLEAHIKSFFACWNVKIMRKHDYTFLMGNRNPGYELQDLLKAKGYTIGLISPRKLFKYLDHVEAGTVGLNAGYTEQNRRFKRKKSLLEKLSG